MNLKTTNYCEYCGQETTNNPQRINNRKIWVCDKAQCQQAFYNDAEAAAGAAIRYDDWITTRGG